MRIAHPWERLDERQLWCHVDADHNAQIAAALAGATQVLDVGCGYGSLSRYLCRGGVRCIGIDVDMDSLRHARASATGGTSFLAMSSEAIAFGNNRFDGVVLRDALHHLVGEGELAVSLSELKRVLNPGGKLVIFDPQPNLVVLGCRWLVRHRDWRCSAEDAVRILSTHGWRIVSLRFAEAFALPLSGGYVGPVLVPPWPRLHRWLVKLNGTIAHVVSSAGLGSHLLWRYLLIAEAPKMEAP